jgi:hypothetical protein
LKPVHWLSNSQTMKSGTTNSECEDTVQFDTGVVSRSLQIIRIHPGVAQEYKIPRLLATLHNTRWTDHCEVHHRGFKAIPKLDPVPVGKQYCYTVSHHHCLHWHSWSSRWHYASGIETEDSMEGRPIFCCESFMTEAVQILCWGHSNNRSASHFHRYTSFFQAVAIMLEVGGGNGY